MTVQDERAAAGRLTAPITGGRAGGWMLALSPVGYVVVVVTMGMVFAGTVGAATFAEITRGQMDALGPGWAIAHIIVAAAAANVVIGAALIAGVIARRLGGPSRALAWCSVAVGAVVLAMLAQGLWQDIAMAGFTTPTLGEDPRWNAGLAWLPVSFGLPVVQLLLLCIALWVPRLRPLAGLVIGIVCLVALIVIAVAAEFVPPFVLALIGCPIGISWVRGVRRARRGLS